MQKIKSLMARQGLKSPQESMADLSPVENLRIPSKEELRELREQPIDPQAEQEIIDSIEEVYFSNDSFDMVQHELEGRHSSDREKCMNNNDVQNNTENKTRSSLSESPCSRLLLAVSSRLLPQQTLLRLRDLYVLPEGSTVKIRSNYCSIIIIIIIGDHITAGKRDINAQLQSTATLYLEISQSTGYLLKKYDTSIDIDTDKPKDYFIRYLVSKKVADLILEKQPAYVKELERVTALQTNLQLAAVICTNARRQLSVAKEGFTGASLGLLANQRRRQLLTGLLKSLRTIKTLQRTDVRLSEMLEEEDYPGAIQLCLECQKAASTFKHYSCISELNSKLQDTLEQIEEQLDVALSKTCKHFDVSHYTKVQLAYTLLGKTQTAMDQLHMHFTQAIHNTVFQVVLGYVELCAGNADTKFQKMQYKDLCTHITLDSYIPCLTDLCKALWEVMLSYHRTMQWHEEHDKQDATPTPDDAAASESDKSVVDRSYVKKKLEHGLTRIWQDVQLKVKAYILGTDMSNFKYDDFIVVLDVISRLMQVGEEFCGSKSEVLQESIKRQSVNYFKNYHRARLEELRMFLENETWELCPVKSNFNIAQLHVSKLRRENRPCPPRAQLRRSCLCSSSTFRRETPLRCTTEHKEEETEDVLASNGYESDELEKSVYQDYDSDSDVPEELKQDYVDEQTGDVPLKSVSRETIRSKKKSDYNLNKTNAPILTNTTLNVIRLVGKYMQMMNILKPIAFDVIHCVSQLFDYYLYAVYTFFGRNDMYESSGLGLISSRLRTTLNRIQESLIDMEAVGENAGVHGPAEDRKEKVPSPHLSQLVVLTNSGTLYGLAQRVVATESL
ncbi:Syndetin, partial [Larimichthys crocea]